ncbi:hypothetical protein DPMN_048623 [Dreissena polymorpha]|uniref:Uncharacterized protein n=1 Tax=Dreissena polymorpha TaxID=45954 RepID=A0A9D4I2K4_DREPO|nr:hypothetical protein DPMN_048623 [Dreissena polymorpha]
MVRHVYCMTSDREMYLDDAECEAAKKPATIATCVKMACQQPKWVVQDWSEVSSNVVNSFYSITYSDIYN